MSRSRPDWHGRTPDSEIPDRVKDRVAKRAGDCCQICQRPIVGKLRAEFDHVTPLILGGGHCESNLQLLCNECHRAKTKLDVKLKAKVARVRKRHLGIPTRKGPKLQSRGFEPRPKQRTATRPIEKWSPYERSR